MRQLKLVSIAFIAILSLSIAATTAAQAVELKMLPEKAKFSFKSSGATRWKTLGGKAIECESVSGTGEAVSERLGLVDFLFLGCKEPTLKVNCTGLNDTTTGSILVHAEYHLRHLLEHPTDVDLVILILGDGTTGSTAEHYSCFGVLFTRTGCLASDDILLVNKELWLAGQLEKELLVNFLPKEAGSGDALNTSIDTDNSLGMESCMLLTKQEAGTAESTSLEVTLTFQNCEHGGVACTFLYDLTGTQ